MSQITITHLTRHTEDQSHTFTAGSDNVFVAVCEDSQCDFSFIHEQGASSRIVIIYPGYEGTQTSSRVTSVLDGDDATSHVHVLTLLGEGADVHVDGSVQMNHGLRRLDGHLTERNLIIGDRIRLRTLPMLDVQTDDVSASHGCQVDRVDEREMFYMMSKGIARDVAHGLIVDGAVQALFDLVPGEQHQEQLQGLKTHVLTKVLPSMSIPQG